MAKYSIFIAVVRMEFLLDHGEVAVRDGLHVPNPAVAIISNSELKAKVHWSHRNLFSGFFFFGFGGGFGLEHEAMCLAKFLLVNSLGQCGQSTFDLCFLLWLNQLVHPSTSTPHLLHTNSLSLKNSVLFEQFNSLAHQWAFFTLHNYNGCILFWSSYI